MEKVAREEGTKGEKRKERKVKKDVGQRTHAKEKATKREREGDSNYEQTLPLP